MYDHNTLSSTVRVQRTYLLYIPYTYIMWRNKVADTRLLPADTLEVSLHGGLIPRRVWFSAHSDYADYAVISFGVTCIHKEPFVLTYITYLQTPIRTNRYYIIYIRYFRPDTSPWFRFWTRLRSKFLSPILFGFL